MSPDAVVTWRPSTVSNGVEVAGRDAAPDAGSAVGLHPGPLPVEGRVRGQRGDVAHALAEDGLGRDLHDRDAGDLVDEPLLDLEQGRVALAGPGPELLNDPHVKKAYLGA